MNRVTWGTVTVISPLAVQLDGDAAALPYAPDCLIEPAKIGVGDRVLVLWRGKRIVVVGTAGGPESTVPASLSGSTDLNTLTNNGTYRQGTSGNATLALNYPVASIPGVLEVIGTGRNGGTVFVVQRYYSREGTNGDREYVRTAGGSTLAWSAWREVGEKGQNGLPYATAVGKSVSTSSSATVTVTFPSSRFAFAPAVAVTPTSGTAPIIPVVTSVGTTSFTLACVNASGVKQAVTADWIAVQQLSTGAAG